MNDWLWQHIAGPVLSGAFGAIPAWVWLIVAALALGWAWRTFGWQGLVAVALAVLTLGAYRRGWNDRSSLDAGQPSENISPASPDAAPSFHKPKPTRQPQAPPELDSSTGRFKFPPD